MCLHVIALTLSLIQNIIINYGCASRPKKSQSPSVSLTSVNGGPGQRGNRKCTNEGGNKTSTQRSKRGKTTH